MRKETALLNFMQDESLGPVLPYHAVAFVLTGKELGTQAATVDAFHPSWATRRLSAAQQQQGTAKFML